jgi:hypothetical protein
VVPDFAIRIDAELELTLNGRNAPIRIERLSRNDADL